MIKLTKEDIAAIVAANGDGDATTLVQNTVFAINMRHPGTGAPDGIIRKLQIAQSALVRNGFKQVDGQWIIDPATIPCKVEPSDELRLRLAEEALTKNGFMRVDGIWMAPPPMPGLPTTYNAWFSGQAAEQHLRGMGYTYDGKQWAAPKPIEVDQRARFEHQTFVIGGAPYARERRADGSYKDRQIQDWWVVWACATGVEP